MSQNTYLKFILIGFLSAGIGNTLNLFYPPFAIVDYLYLEPLNKLLNSGIMNFADLIIYVCQLSIVLFIIIYLPIKIIQNNKAKKRVCTPNNLSHRLTNRSLSIAAEKHLSRNNFD